MPKPPEIRLKELKSEADFDRMLPLLEQLNPSMPPETIRARLAAMRKEGYRCLGAWDGKALVGICGFWIGTRIWCGKYIALDNVVVAEPHRGRNIGKRMTAWAEAEGRRLNCDVAALDSYATSAQAHRFYFREGYHIEGYHMIKELKAPGSVSRVKR
jgi:GNAT superfamily N-acetyltransferase